MDAHSSCTLQQSQRAICDEGQLAQRCVFVSGCLEYDPATGWDSSFQPLSLSRSDCRYYPGDSFAITLMISCTGVLAKAHAAQSCDFQMANNYDWSPTRNFLRAKTVAGIRSPVRFAAGEFNYRNWSGTNVDRANGFMTTLWDQLMVVASQKDSQRVGLFSMPYNLADARQEKQTTLAFDWNEDGTYGGFLMKKAVCFEISFRRPWEWSSFRAHRIGLVLRCCKATEKRPGSGTIAKRFPNSHPNRP